VYTLPESYRIGFQRRLDKLNKGNRFLCLISWHLPVILLTPIIIFLRDYDKRDFNFTIIDFPHFVVIKNVDITGTCFIKKIYAPSSFLLQVKHLPFSSSPLRLNIFHLFVILSLTQLYRYTPEIFLFSTATFEYTYRAPLRRIGQE
jgi:hypothetical protein